VAAYFKKSQRVQVKNLFTLHQGTNGAVVGLEFNPKWLEAHKLAQPGLPPSRVQPTIRLHPSSLAAYYPYESCDLEAAFGAIVAEIERALLFEGPRVELELPGFGRIFKSREAVGFAPLNALPAPFYQPFDAQTLQRFPIGRTVKNVNFKLPKIRGEESLVERPLEILVSQDTSNYEKKNPIRIRRGLPGTRGEARGAQENQARASNPDFSKKGDPAFLAAKAQHDRAAEEFRSGTIDNFEFDRSQYFSQVFRKPSEIWNQQYLRPAQTPSELPKVLERHSQTKAKPMALMFNSLSVSSRVAINYTPLSKYLYLDPRAKRITILNNNENDVYSIERLKRKAQSDGADSMDLWEDPQADESNSDDDSDVLERQLQASQKFQRCVEQLIRADEVIDFSPKLLESLREHAAQCLKNTGGEGVEELLEPVFAEIQRDFKTSLKKGILHYLLKDSEERRRLGLAVLPEPPEEYGSSRSSQVMVKTSRGMVASLRAYLSENLLLFSQETNDILRCWEMFESESLFNFGVSDSGIEIAEFIEQQRANIVRIRTLITSTWVKRISEIYKVRAKSLKKRQLRIFFDTMGAVISSQIRHLIESSLRKIVGFFEQFDRSPAVTLAEAWERFNTPRAPLEKFFLIVNLRESEGRLVFENETESVTEELVEIIKDAVKCSENVARPENFFHRLEKNNLDSVSLSERLVEDTIATVRRVVTANFENIQDFDFIFRDFYYLFDERASLTAAIGNGIDQEALLAQFQKYVQLEDDIVRLFPSEVPFNMVKINASGIKDQLRAIPVELRRTIEDHVYHEIEAAATLIVKTLKNNFDGLTTRIDTVEKLIEKETWLNNFKSNEFPALQTSYQDIIRWYDRFSPYIRFSFERLKHIFEAKEQIIDYRGKIEKEESRIRCERETLEKRLVGRKGVVNSKAADLAVRVEGYRREGKAFWIEKMVNDLADAKTSLTAITKDIELINKEEELMGFPRSEFENVRQSATSILLFESFWSNLSDWTTEHEKWEKTVIFKLDKDKVSEKCASIHRSLQRLLGEFKTLGLAGPEPIALGEKMVAAIDAFQVDFEMVKYFCNPGLAARHWAEINRHLHQNGVEVKLESGGTYYISTLKDLNLTPLQAGIAEISATATREFENEHFLNGVEAEFDAATIELREYKHSTEMYVLPARFADNTILSLNNHLFRIDLMAGSPFAAVFKDKMAELSKMLQATRAVFSLWTKLQAQWTYLEPIFNTDDVVKSLPQESMKFKEVQVAFRGFVLARKRDPSFKELSFDSELSKKLAGMIEMLENVDKNLENYLNKKRADFPRLYFLSSEAMIELIAAVKSPARLGKHIRGMFGGVGDLRVNQSDEIEGLTSFEGESLVFTQKIAIRAFKGHVERWLAALEESIVYEVKRNLITSLQEYAKLEREAFVVGRLSQIVLNVFQTAWTFETENSISLMGYKGLKENASEVDKSLKALAALLPKLASKTDVLAVETVISRSIHNRNVLGHLAAQKVQKVSDFVWESQLRIYWEQNNIVENSTSKLQMMYASLYYAYEFVGPSAQFIVTPLSDRCFRNFFVASQAFYGHCLEGPSATGKTETIKEFARAAGRFLLILNGSALMDSKTVVRVLKGVATSGCWACMDEVNLIKPDVLSVLAQHLHRIQTALSQGRHEFVFNGSMVKLKSNCNVFVTVNSGFAETVDLPENVRYLFRATAVVNPDASLILENRLFCAGFCSAPVLARKIVVSLDFAGGLFHSQKQQDFSLRRMVAVVTKASHLKSEKPDNDESNLVTTALMLVVEPRLSPSEARQFREMLQVHFGREIAQLSTGLESGEDFRAMTEFVENSNSKVLAEQVAARKWKRPKLTDAQPSAPSETSDPGANLPEVKGSSRETWDSAGLLDASKQFLAKVLAVRCQMSVASAVILLGDTMTGKSKALEVLSRFTPNMEVVRVYSDSMSFATLFGFFDEEKGEWSKGVLEGVFRKLAEKVASGRQVALVLDGQLNSAWTESLNTLLDESRRLTLPSGDALFLPPNTSLLFETDSVGSCSPATVSRCGMVYFESDDQRWKSLLRAWVSSLDFLAAPDQEKIGVFFQAVYEPLLRTVRGMPRRLALNDCQVFRTFVVMAKQFVARLEGPESLEMDGKEKVALLDVAFLFCAIWAFGSLVAESSLKAFDLAIKKTSKTPDKSVPSEVCKQFRKIPLPESGLVFDQKVVFAPSEKEKGKLVASWKPWGEQPIEQSPALEAPSLALKWVVWTPEQERQTQLMSMLTTQRQNVFIYGPVASGKSVIMRRFEKALDTESVLIARATWGNGTTSRELSNLVSKNVTRKINEETLYPVGNKSGFVVSVEDVNLGAAPAGRPKTAPEFLRALLENSSFFDLEDSQKGDKRVFRPQILATATRRSAEPGVSARLLSQFGVLAVGELDDDSLNRIFSARLSAHFSNEFAPAIGQRVPKMVGALVEMFRETKKRFEGGTFCATSTLSSRDAIRVVEALGLASPANFKNLEEVLRLFMYECFRSFRSRLDGDAQEQELVGEVLRPVFAKNFSTSLEQALGLNEADDERHSKLTSLLRRLTFTTFSASEFNPKGGLSEVGPKQKIGPAVESFLSKVEGDDQGSSRLPVIPKTTDLILKIFALFDRPSSHLALIDCHEAAVRKCAKVSCSLAGAAFVPLEPSKLTREGVVDLREFVDRELAKSVGGQKALIYVHEAEMKSAEAFDLVSALLNNSERSWNDHCSQANRQPQASEEGGQPAEEVLGDRPPDFRLMLYFHPASELFRQLCRDRPSLMSCCETLNWPSWPAEVLRGVSSVVLNETVGGGASRQNFENALVEMHEISSSVFKEFGQRRGVDVDVGPGKFEEFMRHFRLVYEQHGGKTAQKIRQMEEGLATLQESEQVVLQQNEKMEKLRPALDATNQKIAAVLAEIEQESKVVSEKEQLVAAEERKIRTATEAAGTMAEECQYEVNLIQPELDRAKEEISKITKPELDELRQMKNPPMPVQFAMQALCLLLNTKPELKRDPVSGRSNPDWWATSRLLLNSLSIDQLVNFDNAAQLDEATFKRLDAFINDPKSKEYLEENSIKFSSPTACGLYVWVTGQMNLFSLNQALQPKRKALEEANSALAQLQLELKSKLADFEEVQAALLKLKSELAGCRAQKQKVEEEIAQLVRKTNFAQKLLSAMPDEKERWQGQLVGLREAALDLPGEVLMLAGFLTYLGVLDCEGRTDAVASWTKALRKEKLLTERFDSRRGPTVLFPVNRVQEWIFAGLQSDSPSIENAILIDTSKTSLLLIDPHLLAKSWIGILFKAESVVWTRPSELSFRTSAQSAVTAGSVLCVDDALFPLDPDLEALTLGKFECVGEERFVSFGGAKLSIGPGFRLILLSRAFPPKSFLGDSAAATVVNFEVTREGLTQQLVTQVFAAERPSLEAQYKDCLVDHFTNSAQLESVEARVLETLSKDKSRILEDSSAIDVLVESKQAAAAFKEKQIQLSEAYAEVLATRKDYEPFALRMASLFIVAVNFRRLNQMYSVCLEDFVGCLSAALQNKQPARSVAQRLTFVEDLFLQILCKTLCKGFFSTEKLIFVLVLCLTLETLQNGELPEGSGLDFLLMPADSVNLAVSERPKVSWLSDKQWRDLNYLGYCNKKLKQICQEEGVWRSLGEVLQSEQLDVGPLQSSIGVELAPLERLCLLKALHPERMVEITQRYIGQRLGEDFLELTQKDEFENALSVSSINRPVLLLVQPGVDPFAFLASKNTRKNSVIENTLIGKDQADPIGRVIEESAKNGNWVLVQSFGPAEPVWASILKRISAIKSSSLDIAKSFRLFVSCEKVASVPAVLLQNSVHFAIEEPEGLKSGLKTILEDELLNNQEFLDSCDKKKLLQQIATPLCFFHAIVQERGRLHTGGFSRKYRFSAADFKVTLQQLQALLSKLGDDFSIQIIREFILECNYGARLVNERDLKMVGALIDCYLNPQTLRSGQLKLRPENADDSLTLTDLVSRQKALEFVQKLPDGQDWNLMGFSREKYRETSRDQSMHLEASILKIFSVLQENKPLSRLNIQIKWILKEIPDPIDATTFGKKTGASPSFLNAFIATEMDKMNRLLLQIRSDLESDFDSQPEINRVLALGKVPANWRYWKCSSEIPLRNFLQFLRISVAFFNSVAQTGKVPSELCLFAFSNPKTFIQALKSNFAVETGLHFESVGENVEVVNSEVDAQSAHSFTIPEVRLLYANWEPENQSLSGEATPTSTQKVKLKLSFGSGKAENGEREFDCPIYLRKPLDGAGQILEEVLMVKLKCAKSQNANLCNGTMMVIMEG
jgi:dynein heavy chain